MGMDRMLSMPNFSPNSKTDQWNLFKKFPMKMIPILNQDGTKEVNHSRSPNSNVL